MTVVLSAFLAETQTAHDRNTFTSIGEESGRFGWRVQHLFLAIQLDCLEKPGRKRVVLIWLGSCVLTRLCFVNNDHKITSYLKRRVK